MSIIPAPEVNLDELLTTLTNTRNALQDVKAGKFSDALEEVNLIIENLSVFLLDFQPSDLGMIVGTVSGGKGKEPPWPPVGTSC